VPHFQFLGLLWGLDCRLAGFLLASTRLGVRSPIPKLLCYLAAKSLRATKVEPVQTGEMTARFHLHCCIK
jgi:hypothetical protein